MKIGIIGVGMVGSAVLAGSEKCELICTYDKYRPERTTNWHSIGLTSLCFVCVPTPTSFGRQDLSAVSDALRRLADIGYMGVVVIKSTVLPGTMLKLQNQFIGLRLVHNPEFLCERTAIIDYADQRVLLASGALEDVRQLRRYADLCLNLDHVHYSVTFEATEWAKMIHNCMLPVQLSFLNEVYDLINHQGTFDMAVSMAHWFGNVNARSKVPGPDGQRGWGGMCFVKDTLAMLNFAGPENMKTLAGAISANKTLRPGAYDGSEKSGLI